MSKLNYEHITGSAFKLPEVSFPVAIDSTMLADASCPRKFTIYHLLNLRTTSEAAIKKVNGTYTTVSMNTDILAGAALAAGVAKVRTLFYDEKCKDYTQLILEGWYAIAEHYGDHEPRPRKMNKHLWCVLEALVAYFDKYPLGRTAFEPVKLTSGKHGIEVNFVCEPFSQLHPETKEPILFCGRLDMLAYHKDHGHCILDEKTTPDIVYGWGRPWLVRPQFSAYCYGAKTYGYDTKTVVVRGIKLSTSGISTIEEICPRTEEQIEDWLKWASSRVDIMLAAYKEIKQNNTLRSVLGQFDNCASYGGCSLIEACANSAHVDLQVSTNTIYHKWEPLNHGSK